MEGREYRLGTGQKIWLDLPTMKEYTNRFDRGRNIPEDSRENKESQKQVFDSPISKPKRISNFPFEEFWGVYPLKKGKAQAEKTWKRMSEEARGFAINSIQRYISSVNPQYMQHGSTYLSQKTWEEPNNRLPLEKGRELTHSNKRIEDEN